MDTPRTMLLALVSLATAGCAAWTPQQLAANRSEFQRTVPTCTNALQCEHEWAAARNWVAGNCGMKIKNVTANRIETYYPAANTYVSANLACRVSKDPLPSGGYALHIAVGCPSAYRCYPEKWKSVLAFNRTVSAAGAPYWRPPPMIRTYSI